MTADIINYSQKHYYATCTYALPQILYTITKYFSQESKTICLSLRPSLLSSREDEFRLFFFFNKEHFISSIARNLFD